MCAVIGHLYLNEFIFSSRLAKNCRNVSRPPDRTSGGSRGGARSPPPKGWKNFFWRPGSSLFQGLDDPPPPLIWRSGSAIENWHWPDLRFVQFVACITGALWAKRAECSSSWLKKSGSCYAIRCTSPILLGSYVASTQPDPITIIHCRISCFCFSAVVLGKKTVNPDVNSF